MDRWYELIYRKLKESGNLIRISEEFSELRSNHERVSFTWKLDCVRETLEVREIFLEKSAAKSILARTEGNKEFQNKKFSEALSRYNESVRYATMSSFEKEFSMAVANRSAVLIHMKKYNECLMDIELSLSFGYPEVLKYKLYERQGKCHFFRSTQSHALESFKKAKELLALSNLTPEKTNALRRNLDSWIKRTKEVLKQNDNNSKLITPTAKYRTPGLTNGGNAVFPCLSTKVDVSYDNEKGRHIKAVEEVQVGDVLAVEKPYASVLLPENYPTHCLHCLKRVLSPFPCRQCARVGFCNESCESLAWAYHRFECKYQDFLAACDVGKFGLLALRVMTKTTWPTLREFDSEKCPEEPTLEDGSPSNSVYRNTYFEIYHLVAHTEDRSTSDLFRRAIMSVLLAKCLDTTGYFGQRPSREDLTDVICVGSHILRMLQVLPCNAHEISEFLQIDKDLVNSHTIEIAAAIYATFSLFNHCCDPCVTRNFYGDTCVMRSIQTIPKGDEVLDNYGYVSAVTPLPERQAELKKQYYFACTCPACCEGWPLYAELESRVPILKCRRCHQRVPSDAQTTYQCWFCKEEMNVQARFSEVYDAGACLKVGIDKMVEGDDKTALPQLIACIDRLDHCVSRPWQDINSCQQGIIQCYNVLQSNRHVVRR